MEAFVVILFYDHEPCRVYGEFPSEEAACAWINTRDDFGAATVHQLRNPEE